MNDEKTHQQPQPSEPSFHEQRVEQIERLLLDGMTTERLQLLEDEALAFVRKRRLWQRISLLIVLPFSWAVLSVFGGPPSSGNYFAKGVANLILLSPILLLCLWWVQLPAFGFSFVKGSEKFKAWGLLPPRYQPQFRTWLEALRTGATFTARVESGQFYRNRRIPFLTGSAASSVYSVWGWIILLVAVHPPVLQLPLLSMVVGAVLPRFSDPMFWCATDGLKYLSQTLDMRQPMPQRRL